MRSVFALAFLLLATVPSLRAEEAEDFRLVDVKGNVAVVPAGGGEPRVATVGLPLEQGDRIETSEGASAELAAKSGTVIRLDSNTSLGLEDLRSGWTTFRLTVGRFLGKFQKSFKSRYNIKTPIAVASVRGTEFVLDVAEDGALDAGVVEGEVAVTRPEPAANEGVPSDEWGEEVLTASQGLEVRPLQKPHRLNEIPRPLVRSMDWFPQARARVPKLRETWKDLDPPARQQLRQQSLRQRVQWNVPPRHHERMTPPRQRTPPRPVGPPKRPPKKPQHP